MDLDFTTVVAIDKEHCRRSVFRSISCELDLNNVQISNCIRHAGAARYVYNWGLSDRISEYRSTGKSSGYFGQCKKLTKLKSSNCQWLYEVSKCATQNALRRLDDSFKNFFAKRAKFPKFKSKKNGVGSFCLNGHIRIIGKFVQLPKIGKVKMKESPVVYGKILSATVKCRASRWFVIFQVEVGHVVPENQGPTVGVDLGINKLATCSDGTVFENARPLKRRLNLLRRAQKVMCRRRRGSKRRERARRRAANIHYRVANIRKDAIHKATMFLAKNFSAIGIEDLNVKGMLKNRILAQALKDSSLGEFRRQLAYKCEWYGSKLVVADRFYPSSKRCARCGHVKENLDLAEKVYRCEKCGLEIGRDANASQNLRPEVLRSLGVEAVAATGKQDRCQQAKPVKRQPSVAPAKKPRRTEGPFTHNGNGRI